MQQSIPRSPVFLEEDDWNRIQRDFGLSRRELQVVQHVFMGQKLAEISSELGLALGTVKTYLHRIYRKLNISSLQELILTVVNDHMSRNGT